MAEAVIGAVAEEAVGGCINQIKHHFNYLAQYHHNMENLNAKLHILESKRDEVHVKVFIATDKGETIMDNVQKWLGEVNDKKNEAEEILKDKERVGNGCWRGWFLNFNLRYRLSKKAMKKSVDLDTFLARGEFEIVAHPKRPLAHVSDSAGASSLEKMKNTINHQVLEVHGNEESNEGSTSEMSAPGADGGLTSRSTILNDVLAAVRDPKIRIIRICGMGGIGKTTLVKQVEKRARAERLFNEIAMVEVNQNPDIKILQLHIAELFGIELKEDSVPARAKRLSDRLNAKDQKGENKRILLILDNVWKKEGLEEAGIPLTEEKSLCKILLTSRSVLVCKDIAPEPEFNIGVLSHPESLILFHQCLPKEPPFYDEKMAEELVKECGGLPISITVIARAVAYKSKESWTNALGKLQKSEFEGEYRQVLNSLKVSYDFLENEEIKRFFRLFCFFRKGSDVLIEDLARYGMGLGCFTNPEKLYDARIEAHSYTDVLLQSSLLLHGDKAGCFKVHDIVWDLAVQVPSNDLFIINHGDELIKSKRREPNQNYTSMSLQCNEMVEVPKGVDFRNLKFLQLIGNSGTHPLEFPNNFFEEMHELNVLAFRNQNVTSLPKSVQLLRNLLSLSFDRCSIGSDISMIGNLGKLEILSFAHSNIQELPIQIANLKGLRLLDVTGCDKLIVLPPNVLSNLSFLEELYMRGTPLQLRSGSPTIFSEIASMSKLVVIDIAMPVEVLPMDSLFSNLKHFKISITGSERGEKDRYLFENFLDLECDSAVLQQHGVKLLLPETVRMDLKVTNLKNLFPLNDSEVENFSNLKNLSIESCNEMKYLVNMVGYPDHISIFQNLVSLQLYELPHLEEIFHVWSYSESSVAPLCKLKVLKVEKCHELEHLFSASDARSLNKLEVIEVKSCDKLKVVLGKGRRGEEDVELSNLKYMTLKELPNLVGCCSDVDAPEFPQLEELNISYLPLITSIIQQESVTFDSSYSDDSSSHPLFSYKGQHTSCKFQNLKAMAVNFCDSLKHLLTTSIAISFRELHNLEVGWCISLITIIAEEGIKEEKEKRSATEVLLFPKLKVLNLNGLVSLSTFLPKGYTLTWSSLKKLTLDRCAGEWNTLFPNKNNIQGRTITSVSTATNKLVLTSLEELDFCGMNISSGFWYDYFPHGFSYELRIFLVGTPEQSIMFSPHMIREFRHLTRIILSFCTSLEVVFDLEEECIVEEVGSKLPTLNKLDYLDIYYLPKLINVWKKVPYNFHGFGNLTCLVVRDCDRLRYLFVPSIAKCLVKLKGITIHNCKVMEEIVSMRDEEGELTDDIILFPQLQELFLKDLPSLKYLEDPNVVESTRARDNVSATNTSASNIISSQESIDPNLPALVRLEGIVCPWPWSFHKLKRIGLSGCNNLSSIFPPNRVVRLPALEKISVRNCENLQYIFSSSMAKSLEQLMELTIEGCNMMEVIRKDEEEEDVDGRIKVGRLESIKLDNLPNLEGICLGMLSFDWLLLRSVAIEDCSKMRIFTSGYSNTPLLNHLTINEDVYDPTVEGVDVNTVLRNAQIKDANFLALLGKEGIHTINGFRLAGEYLIAHYSIWSWESSYNKREQYLIARNVPCLTKPRNTTSVVENEVDHGEDEMNIYKSQTYDVSITYDENYRSTRLWLKGYDDDSTTDLPLDLVFQDINMEYLQKSHVTLEYHPYQYPVRHISLFPIKKPRSIVKKLITNLFERGFDPSVQNHLKLIVDELFPTFQFDPPH